MKPNENKRDRIGRRGVPSDADADADEDEALADHFVDLRGEAAEAAQYKARNRVVGSSRALSEEGAGEKRKRPSPTLSTAAAPCEGSSAPLPLSKEEKIALIKQRLRGCWWGPRVPKEVARRLRGKEIGNMEDGKGNSFATLHHEFAQSDGRDAETKAKRV